MARVVKKVLDEQPVCDSVTPFCYEDEKIPKQSKNFILTKNNPDLNPEQFTELLKSEGVVCCVFNLEVGEQGTPHYQAYLHFATNKRFTTLCQKFKCWVRPCKNVQACVNYCMKSETRIEGPWSWGFDKEIKPPTKWESTKYITEEMFKGWQREIYEKAKSEPEPRLIYWYWEPSGNVGKTELCKHLVDLGALILDGKASDAIYAIAALKKDKKEPPKIIVWDLSRSREQFVSWEAIEKIKNGLAFNSKYECGMLTFPTPHIFIFANFEPDMAKLSMDRWRVRRIEDSQPGSDPVGPLPSPRGDGASPPLVLPASAEDEEEDALRADLGHPPQGGPPDCMDCD